MNYDYDNYKKKDNLKTIIISTLIGALIVMIIANVVTFTLIKSNLQKEMDTKMAERLTELEAQLDGKVDDAMVNRLTTTISNQVKDNLVEDISQSSYDRVASELTDNIINDLRREYNLPEDYAGIGVIVAREVGSVVEISASAQTNAGRLNIAGAAKTVSSVSSGIIITADGYVLTNAHCVVFEDDIWTLRGWYYQSTGKETKLYDTLEMNFKNSTTKYTLQVVDYDVDKDIAIAKIVNPPSNLKPIRFADSDLLVMGEEVAAMGNGAGLGIFITTGVLSDVPEPYYGVEVIQTDAAINPGNSGGAIFNIYGEFIGLVSFKVVSSEVNEGLGFAIASNSVREYIDHVASTKGITINYISPVTD